MANVTVEEIEEARVTILADSIGYGRTMQLCEKLWRAKLDRQGCAGGEHSRGCAVAFLVPCPCVDREGVACDWCCGSGRVTKKVLEAMRADEGKD